VINDILLCVYRAEGMSETAATDLTVPRGTDCICRFDKLENDDEGRDEFVSVALQLSILDIT